MRPVILLVAVLAVTPFTTVTAQDSPPVRPDDRVRITHDCTSQVLPVTGETRTRCQQGTGTVARLTGDSLVLTIDNRETSLAVSLASVTELEVSRGRKSLIARQYVLEEYRHSHR